MPAPRQAVAAQSTSGRPSLRVLDGLASGLGTGGNGFRRLDVPGLAALEQRLANAHLYSTGMKIVSRVFLFFRLNGYLASIP